MLKIFHLSFYAVLALVLLLFILSNRAPMELNLFPFASKVTLPAYATIAIFFVLGLMIGLLHSFWRGIGFWREKRNLEKQLRSYQKTHDTH
ncbi:MAG: LapA family protein [Alphaproteobacteria bacterium]|jgi:uncharacterized integral membrane protein|nr:LapA family protein [Rickettsiales bacterium]